MQGTSGSALNGSGTTGLYAALVDTGTYTYSSSHEFYSSISAGVVGTPVELSGKSFTNGLLDSSDATLTAVAGSSAEAIVLYVKNAGANTTWRLFAYIDSGATGLPVTPNGSDISVVMNASGIVQL
jgi:hypothetical protein